jgi:hypothetical protein
MAIRSTLRYRKNKPARRLTSYQPELVLLEDRLPPGQFSLSGVAGMTFFGPSLDMLQADSSGSDGSALSVLPTDSQGTSLALAGSSDTAGTAGLNGSSSQNGSQAPANQVSSPSTVTTVSAPASSTDTAFQQDLAGLAASSAHSAVPTSGAAPVAMDSCH